MRHLWNVATKEKYAVHLPNKFRLSHCCWFSQHRPILRPSSIPYDMVTTSSPGRVVAGQEEVGSRCRLENPSILDSVRLTNDAGKTTRDGCRSRLKIFSFPGSWWLQYQLSAHFTCIQLKAGFLP